MVAPLAIALAALLPASDVPPPAGLPPGGPASVPLPAPAPAAAGARRYDDEYVALEDYPWVTSGTDGSVSTSIRTIAVQGRYRRPLEGAEFYRVVGRPDLAATFEDRLVRRNTHIGLGLGTALLGTIVMAAGSGGSAPDVHLSPDAFRRAMDEEAARTRRAMVAGGLVTLGGMLLAIAGISTDPNPVPVHEARRLADEHNQRLRREQGPAPGTPSASEAGAPAAPALSLGVAPAAGGASALLRVAF